MARQLSREAEALAGLAVDQDALLGGAERAAAMVPVLDVAGVLDGELSAMLRAAASGMRGAVNSETRSTYAARFAALERRMGTPAN